LYIRDDQRRRRGRIPVVPGNEACTTDKAETGKQQSEYRNA